MGISKKGLFVALLLIGLAMVAAGYAMEQYYKANIADKNGDGVKDWKDIDINGDGRVDMRDIVLITSKVGQPTTADNWKSDINGDGFIDETDCNLAAQFFGQGLSVLNIYTNQGKVFLSGIVVTVLALIGIVATRKH
jgi:hypothetical protein